MKYLILLLSLVLFTSCSHHGNKKNSPVEENVTVGSKLKTNRYSDLYFSGQPDMAEFKNLKEEGFVTIINLRDPKEYKESKEKKIVKKLGMNYYNIPFNMKNEMTDEYISQVTSSVVKHRKEGKVLVHCSSGNRVGIWLGGHFFKDHNYSKEDSVKMAKRLGLTKDGAIKKLDSYLGSK